jgi:hypothetical protein|tara:strand:+ start:305 stop:796 length:492 start_codon:yes stop_codon:yes gene_type:complete
MEYTIKDVEYLKNGGEFDFPRLPNTQINEPGNLQSRSLRFNKESGMFEYYQRTVIDGQAVGAVIHQSHDLEDMIDFTNKKHQIDDCVIGETEFIPDPSGEDKQKKEFFFQFKSGGWNSVWAITIDEAKKRAFKQYKDHEVMFDTVKTVEGHESEYNMLLSNFD